MRSLLLFLPLAGLATGNLALHVDSPQRALFPGEPVKVSVSWKAVGGPIKDLYPEGGDFLVRTLVFEVKGPDFTDTYTEFPKGLVDIIPAPVDLAAGEEVIKNLVLSNGGFVRPSGRPRRGLLFEEPGVYLLRAVHIAKGQRVQSNAVRFEVSKPTAAESEVFEVIREAPALLDAPEDPVNKAKFQALLAAHPQSRYLRWARIRLLERKEGDLRNGWDPETDQPLSALPASRREETTSSRYLDLAKEAERGGGWGAFEEDALALVERAASRGGDNVLAEQARKRILEQLPASATARRFKQTDSKE